MDYKNVESPIPYFVGAFDSLIYDAFILYEISIQFMFGDSFFFYMYLNDLYLQGVQYAILRML